MLIVKKNYLCRKNYPQFQPQINWNYAKACQSLVISVSSERVRTDKRTSNSQNQNLPNFKVQ